MYRRINGNAKEAVRLYGMHFTNSALPGRKTFQRLHRRISEIISFLGERQDTGRPQTTRATNQVDAILEAVDKQPRRSTWSTAREQGIHHTTLWRVLCVERLHLYHFQRVQVLQTIDFSQFITFVHWFLKKRILQSQFATSVLFTDETAFTCDGAINAHSNHTCVAVNPHGAHSSGRQRRFSVNVWAGMIHKHLIGRIYYQTA